VEVKFILLSSDSYVVCAVFYLIETCIVTFKAFVKITHSLYWTLAFFSCLAWLYCWM